MATVEEEVGLITGIVTDLVSLAKDSYAAAQQSLDDLANAAQELPLSVIDTDIGTNVNVVWTATIPDVSDVELPSYLDTYIASLPTTAPEVPELTSTVPTFTESAPASPTDEIAEFGALPSEPGDLVLEDLSPAPEAPDLPTLPVLGTLPTIDTVVPTIDQEVLTAEFQFTDPVWAGDLSPTLKTEFLRVLGGDLGVPAAYWTALHAQAAGEIAIEQASALRTARNRGAASYWSLPSEAVLSASRRVADEGQRKLAQARLEITKQQAVMANEDFWKAVQQGLAYEQAWMQYHIATAQRALAAAEALVKYRIEVHNANVQHYNLLLEAAKISAQVDEITTNTVLRAYEGELKGVEIEVGARLRVYEGQLQRAQLEIEQQKALINKYQAQWQGYAAGADAVTKIAGAEVSKYDAHTNRYNAAMNGFAQEVKVWATRAEVEAKYDELLLGAAKTKSEIFATQYQGLNAMASAANAVIAAQVQIEKLKLDAGLADVEREKAINALSVEIGKLTQAAQEAKARIDVAQAQWVDGQANSMLTNLAQLAYGYAQAAVAASDVSYGRSLGTSYSESITASRNAEKVW